jgi:hypothetical protein
MIHESRSFSNGPHDSHFTNHSHAIESYRTWKIKFKHGHKPAATYVGRVVAVSLDIGHPVPNNLFFVFCETPRQILLDQLGSKLVLVLPYPAARLPNFSPYPGQLHRFLPFSTLRSLQQPGLLCLAGSRPL